MRYHELVAREGLSRTHRQILALVRPGAHVLELGCSTGYMSRLLVEQKGCSIVGYEIDPQAARGLLFYGVAYAPAVLFFEASAREQARLLFRSPRKGFETLLRERILSGKIQMETL
jgi:hypothetical protein